MAAQQKRRLPCLGCRLMLRLPCQCCPAEAGAAQLRPKIPVWGSLAKAGAAWLGLPKRGRGCPTGAAHLRMRLLATVDQLRPRLPEWNSLAEAKASRPGLSNCGLGFLPQAPGLNQRLPTWSGTAEAEDSKQVLSG